RVVPKIKRPDDGDPNDCFVAGGADRMDGTEYTVTAPWAVPNAIEFPSPLNATTCGWPNPCSIQVSGFRGSAVSNHPQLDAHAMAISPPGPHATDVITSCASQLAGMASGGVGSIMDHSRTDPSQPAEAR